MKVVVIVSANAEWEGVKSLFPGASLEPTPYGEVMSVTFGGRDILLLHGGWGKIASAASMSSALDHFSPDLVVNLGTCGGLEGVVERGDLILVERTLVYDLLELMDTSDVTDYYASSLDLGWLADPQPHPARRGLIASADSDLLPERVPLLKARGVLAADWESPPRWRGWRRRTTPVCSSCVWSATWSRSMAGRYTAASKPSTNAPGRSCVYCLSSYQIGWTRCAYKVISIPMSSGSSPKRGIS